MRFEPKSEADVASANLFPAGTYDFEVQAAEDQVSKAGNEMIKLTLRVYAQDGSFTTVFDYLLESVAYKLRHAAAACGLMRAYDSGRLEASDFEGRSGRCKLRIQKDKDGQYPDKNTVSDYLPQPDAGERPPPQVARETALVDDDIPF